MQKKLTKEQRKIVEDNHSLIYGFCKLYKLDLDDVYDLLSIALCRSAMCYNSQKGYSFSTYTFQVFRRVLEREQQRNFRQKRIPESKVVSLSTPINSTHTNFNETMQVEECISSDPVSFDRHLLFKDFMDWMNNHLNKKEIKTVQYILAGLTQQEIGNIENITYQGVQYRLRSIAKKIKRSNSKIIIDLIDGLKESNKEQGTIKCTYFKI